MTANDTGARWRWKVAHWLTDRTGRVCWSNLVGWCLHWYPKEQSLRWVFREGTETCRRDAEKCGTCYCGKFSTPDWDQHLTLPRFRPDGSKAKVTR